MIASEQRWESFHIDDAEYILVAYGISSRICEEAAEMARERGLKIGLIRPITVFPFPAKAFESLDYQRVKGFAVAEISCLSQMIEDVVICARGRAPVYPIRGGTKVYESTDVLAEMERISGGEAGERY
jgi:2-oxoglutarate ferredoxin oxidoreductase subunit alpha